MRRRVRCLLALVVLLSPSQAQADQLANAPPATGIGDADKTEAKAHFDKGLALFDVGTYDTALAEFVEARRLYPLRNAVNNAVVCLEKLRRYDEALAKQEELLRDFGPQMPPEAREKAQRKLVELRALVGTIDIHGAEIGSSILVDGQWRGDYPMLGPMRVSAGSHLVRVVKAGFEPFESRVDVRGGGSFQLQARLPPLTRSGRLRVTELQGRSLPVLVDGAQVGLTPWEGRLSVGEHVIALRGEGNLGAPPVSVTITLDGVTPLSLRAEELAAQLRVEPSPVNASVAIDSIVVGRGIWEGRLRTGTHRVEVAAPGFLPALQALNLEKGAPKTLTVVLDRDPRSAFAVRKGHYWLETAQTALISPQFGGDIGNGLAGGGQIRVRAGYELATGLSFGASVGALRLMHTVQGRTTEVFPVDLGADPPISPVQMRLDHALQANALRVGAVIGFSVPSRIPLQVSLEAGAVWGSLADHRSPAPQRDAGFGTLVGSTSESKLMRGLYIAPDVQLGWKLNSHFTMAAGIGILMLVNIDPPVWDTSKTHTAILRDARGRLAYGLFPNAAFGDAIGLAFSPGISLRHDF